MLFTLTSRARVARSEGGLRVESGAGRNATRDEEGMLGVKACCWVAHPGMGQRAERTWSAQRVWPQRSVVGAERMEAEGQSGQWKTGRRSRGDGNMGGGGGGEEEGY